MLMDRQNKHNENANIKKSIYRFSAISIKIPTQFITCCEKANLNFIQKNKKLRVAKTILKNERTSGEITIPDLKVYC